MDVDLLTEMLEAAYVADGQRDQAAKLVGRSQQTIVDAAARAFGTPPRIEHIEPFHEAREVLDQLGLTSPAPPVGCT